MANERNTENLVRGILRDLGYYDDKDIAVEEQSSKISEVKKCLKGASKTGGKGTGAPEFIISTHKTPDFLIVVECKADTKKHQSKKIDNPKDFAVDGVLHYASKLSKSFNIIAIAVSGETQSALKVSNFIFPKGGVTHKKLVNPENKEVKGIIPFKDYIKFGTYDATVAATRQSDLMAFSKDLHEFMRSHAKLTEGEKPLLVSGTLLALRDNAFAHNFGDYKPERLQKKWFSAIEEVVEDTDMPKAKKYSMSQPYASISVHPELGKKTPAYPKGILNQLIQDIYEKVWPFLSAYNGFDVVGQFYGEFLKYTGGDKKALGIVLTPKHITELFSLLANVQKDSKVLDICAGTGGFLIAAMREMMKTTGSDKEREWVKKEGLVGVEQQPNMFALAASNMILSGDGKTNLYQGDCFDTELSQSIKLHKCNIGFLNPPYSQAGAEYHELRFVKHLLDCLEPNGVGIAIVPMSCAIAQNPIKDEILASHTLDAVMSLPDDLFYPVGVVTCIMVFKAHIPHKQTDLKTWFGYWKNDGFVKTKTEGRRDKNQVWESTCDKWVESYKERESFPGESIKRKVGASDEWCAEAYMETDYSKLMQGDFEKVIQNYAVFKLLNSQASPEKLQC